MSRKSELRAKIEKAKVEIANCEKLKPLLVSFADNAFSCSSELGKCYNSLSNGLIIDGKSMGENINASSNDMKKLSSYATTAISNIQPRIDELRGNIKGWEAEIAAIEAEEARKLSWWKKNKSEI